MTTDEKILNELYKIAEDVLADTHSDVGEYYASDLATLKTVRCSYHKTGKETSYNKLTLYRYQYTPDYPITISVDNFTCKFNRCDVFYFV